VPSRASLLEECGGGDEDGEARVTGVALIAAVVLVCLLAGLIRGMT
jgi:hypothetical protein